MTSPFNTATPEAVNPTPADIDSGMPRSQSETTPPVRASGMPVKTSMASFYRAKGGKQQKKDQ